MISSAALPLPSLVCGVGSPVVVSGLGVNVRSDGAEPGGRVCALNSGTASLPTRTPAWCWHGRKRQVLAGPGRKGSVRLGKRGSSF